MERNFPPDGLVQKTYIVDDDDGTFSFKPTWEKETKGKPSNPTNELLEGKNPQQVEEPDEARSAPRAQWTGGTHTSWTAAKYD